MNTSETYPKGNPDTSDIDLTNALKPTDNWNASIPLKAEPLTKACNYCLKYWFLFPAQPIPTNDYVYVYYDVEQKGYVYRKWSDNILGTSKFEKEKCQEIRERLQQNPYHKIVIPNYYRIFFRKTDNKLYFNFGPSVKAITNRKFNDFNEDARNGVLRFWQHIKEVWCNDDEKLYEYNKNWIINTVLGIRTNICLVNSSSKGTGKSIITEFLIDKIFSTQSASSVGKINVFGLFNDIVSFKSLIVFNEFEIETGKSFAKIDEQFKSLITDGYITIKKLTKSDFIVPNFCNFIIHTNATNPLRITIDERRYQFNSVSDKYVGNTDYFNDLTTTLYKTKDIEYAFYAFCKENENPNFDLRKTISTNTDLRIRASNLDYECDFIKNVYIFNNKNINCSIIDLYNEMRASKTYKCPKEFNINTLTNTLERNHLIKKGDTSINISWNELLEIGKENNWISDIEETSYIEPEPEPFLLDYLFQEKENPTINEKTEEINTKKELIDLIDNSDDETVRKMLETFKLNKK